MTAAGTAAAGADRAASAARPRRASRTTRSRSEAFGPGGGPGQGGSAPVPRAGLPRDISGKKRPRARDGCREADQQGDVARIGLVAPRGRRLFGEGGQVRGAPLSRGRRGAGAGTAPYLWTASEGAAHDLVLSDRPPSGI